MTRKGIARALVLSSLVAWPAGTAAGPFIVTGPEAGGGPEVRVFDALTGALQFSFFAFDPGFLGGVRVSTVDANGDGVPDVIVTAGPGGGPHLRVFDGAALQTGQIVELVGIFAYDPGLRAGMFVAGGTPAPAGSGGQNNTAPGPVAVVGGGQGNTAGGTAATVGGGDGNTAGGNWATVAGGQGNTTGDFGVVGGGKNNTAQFGGFVGGGEGNTAGSGRSVVGGGFNNTASGSVAAVGGGLNNTASGSGATVGGGSNNTASGRRATVGGGETNTASSFYATVGGGVENTAAGVAATVPGGYRALAALDGQMAYASGSFAASGDAQTSLFVLRNTTVDATPTELLLDGVFIRLTLDAGRTMTFDVLVVARSTANQSAGYQVRGVLENVGGTASLVGAPAVTTLGEDVAGWDVTAVATNNNGAGGLGVRVTGAAATTIRWVASVRTAEVAQ
jgi:hypothetical protein